MIFQNKFIQKYKLDYIIICSVAGFIGFIAYELFLLPYLISELPCATLIKNLNNDRFSLTDLSLQINNEIESRCFDFTSQSTAGGSRK